MPIQRINEFPEGSGSLSNDDVFLFMDDPSGSGITKKISLSQISNAIGGGNTGDITFNGSTISTANTDQSMTITTNGSGDIYIGADRNMIFDMNAFSGKGILLQDSQEGGYDDVEIPSTLKVGSIYHETGRMVISSDGRILNASGVQVDLNGDPTADPVYGGLWLTNGQDTGFLVPPQTSTIGFGMDSDIEIHNNEKIWEFTIDGNINLPESGLIVLGNNTTISQGTFDNSTGGQSGISLNCYVGYELNWQGGHLKSTQDGGISAANILCDSAIEFPGSGIDNIEINASGLVFSDGTTQITAYTGVAVSGISAGNFINVSSSSGIYTIGSTGEASVIKTSVFNKTDNQIPKFSVVYINGGQGDQPTIALAVASGEMTSSKTYGITAENIDSMDIGYVVVMGALTGLNTDQFNPTAPMGNVNGVSLWLSPTTPGAVTTTKPTAPNHSVYVGTIVRTHQNEGVVEVRIQNGYELEELHNVSISGVSNHDIIIYNSGTSLWENKPGITTDTSGITGASSVFNIVQISQNDYDNLVTKDPNTLYIIV